MTHEEWRPIPGYEGRYDVSNMGRVRSWLPYQGRPLPRIMALPFAKNGYPSVSLRDQDSQHRTWPVHRLVTLTFIGPQPPGQVTRHLDGDKSHNWLSNLRYGTPTENSLDKVEHGTDHNAKKTHCPSGHEYSPENTRAVGGQRWCKACQRARNRRRVTCALCGVEISASGRPGHERRFHGRPPARVGDRKPINHGTNGGYTTHLVRGEPIPAGDPCGCRAAHAASVRENKQRRAAVTHGGTVAA